MKRRSLLLASIAASTASFAVARRARIGATTMTTVTAPALAFPGDFLWGISTSAYQIEGAADADGRGPSIWDVFSHTPGKVANGDTGDVACDHYHRYAEDVALLAGLGIGAYRFSTSWSRILPAGIGAVNPAGLDFYDRLVDALLAAGIDPWLCLYHWDLPQALQERGGWLDREIADWFAGYALVVAGRLGDRVNHWIMLNEPSVVAMAGHGTGVHAPGLRGRDSFLAATHHQNLAQGRALAALRAAARPGWRLGTVLTVSPVRPSTDRDEDVAAARLWDALWNRACLDPLLRGRYPELLSRDLAPLVRDGDLAAIRQPVDFLGLNYYSPIYQRADPAALFGAGFGPAPADTAVTAMGWPIEPDGLTDQLAEFHDRYDNLPVYVTENGAAFDDTAAAQGRIDDRDRIAFIRDHLAACHRAIAAGCNLKGYFLWTSLDNFEWSFGYTKRFGIVEVDRSTMKRTPKASYRWYGDTVRANAVAVP